MQQFTFIHGFQDSFSRLLTSSLVSPDMSSVKTLSADEGRSDEITGSREAVQPAGDDASDGRGEAGERRGEAQ